MHVTKLGELVVKKKHNADKRASKGDTKAIGTEESKGLPRQEAMASEALDVGPGFVGDGKTGPHVTPPVLDIQLSATPAYEIRTPPHAHIQTSTFVPHVLHLLGENYSGT